MFKVDDEATQQLMVTFYQKCLNQGKLRQSFIDAKKELRVEYPEPIYWGAFMMIGLSNNSPCSVTWPRRKLVTLLEKIGKYLQMLLFHFFKLTFFSSRML